MAVKAAEAFLPIIVLGSQEETVETLELGADAYFTKPLETASFVEELRRFV